VIRNLFIAAFQFSAFVAILGIFLTSDAFGIAFGFSGVHLGFAIILYGIMLEPIGILMNIPLSAMSRKAEYKADATAVKAGYKMPMIGALKTLARENYANLTPHPLVVKMTYSHPPIHDRIKAIEKI
jgi:STE24 endopeptidase